MKIVMFCDFLSESLLYQENLVTDQYPKLGHGVTVITSTIASVHDFTADRYDPTIRPSVTDVKGVKVVRLP